MIYLERAIMTPLQLVLQGALKLYRFQIIVILIHSWSALSI